MLRVPKIQYITQDNEQLSHAQQAKLMFEKGIEWVQIRMKNSTPEEIITQAKEAMIYAEKNGGKLIINDSINIALEVNAHGVHLGLHDTPINKARETLGDQKIIGGTANTFQDIVLQSNRGANYIGVGPFRFTSTKAKLSPTLGLKGYKELSTKLSEANINIPLVAVGGINLNDLISIQQTGICAVAISAALLKNALNKL